ncbi:MAG: serine hydroxymethyltransferase, partial [Planctomycetes bacterium]|nr:serine hydroxymethyltransferase [Planctomycetota bacterium]
MDRRETVSERTAPVPAPATPPVAEDFLFRDDLLAADPDTDFVIGAEEDRQNDKLIMIASESLCPRAVQQALASVFSNIYAEGYPSLRMSRHEQELLLDHERQLGYYRRLGDRRFYRGCDFVNFVEVLAQRRAADLFANPHAPADRIWVNVQPLSGAAANNAVYSAFLKPGDVVMGLSLAHGGHLTHGHPANRSGKNYTIVPYTVEPKTGRLDYDAIRALALTHQPKLLIGGGSAYPWDIDWAKLRAIADECDSRPIVMADISHPAGLAVAGFFPNPVGHAHVTTLTTHKTLCGPRGAIILTTNEAHARKIDSAVFPGEQGGPHINQLAAKAVSFKLARTEKFRRLQAGIVENAKALADGLVRRGLKLAYGGTNTHLVLLDLNAVATPSGTPLRGDMASNILDLCGLTCNKNTIAGDLSAARPGAIRLGTTIVTQRGLKPAHMDRIADLVAGLVKGAHTFAVEGVSGELKRAKWDWHLLEEAKKGFGELSRAAARDFPRRTPEPATLRLADESIGRTPELFAEHQKLGARFEERSGWAAPVGYRPLAEELDLVKRGVGLVDLQSAGLLEVRGEHAAAALNHASTADLLPLASGHGRYTLFLAKDAGLIDETLVLKHPRPAPGFDRFLLRSLPANAARVRSWLRALSDGYVLFDGEDLAAKVDGPVVVEDLRAPLFADRRLAALGLLGPRAVDVLARVAPGAAHLAPLAFGRFEIQGIPVTIARTGRSDAEPIYELYLRPSKALALWTLLLREGAGLDLRPVGIQVFEDWRGRASGDRESRDGLVQMKKPYFIGQRVLAKSHHPSVAKQLWAWNPGEAPLKKTCLYDEHVKLTKKKLLIPFGGWSMPVWYSSIGEEHEAVRRRCGLFDIAHMGVFDVAGEHAARFLDLVTTNFATRLRVGHAHYSYVLDPNGSVLDDIYVYRREAERFMVVVNASNAEKIWSWWNAVNARQVVIDREAPWKELDGVARLRDLKDPSSGKDKKVDFALQGPLSLQVLQRAADDDKARGAVAALSRSEFVETVLSGIRVLVSRTGYTGEPLGYELYVNPDEGPALWNLLLDKGRDLGLVATGLGARDSTRTEAGFPLYGHDLAGKWDVNPMEAGYGGFVKRHKPFFIGKRANAEREASRTMEVIRFRVNDKGVKAVKPGDPVVNRKGMVIGSVTSSTLVAGHQLGLACVEKAYAKVGATIGIFPVPHEEAGAGEG